MDRNTWSDVDIDRYLPLVAITFDKIIANIAAKDTKTNTDLFTRSATVLYLNVLNVSNKSSCIS